MIWADLNANCFSGYRASKFREEADEFNLRIGIQRSSQKLQIVVGGKIAALGDVNSAYLLVALNS